MGRSNPSRSTAKRQHSRGDGSIASKSPKRRVTKSSNNIRQHEEDTASTLCQSCGWLINDGADCVKIMPCAHLLCTLCALESHTKRRHACHRCPVNGCNNNPTTSNKYVRAEDGLVKVFNTRVEENEMKDETPVEWLLMRYKSDIKATTQHNRAYVLSATMAEMEDGELCTSTVTSAFVLKVNETETRGEGDGVRYQVLNSMQALIEVGAFFAFLHVIAKASVSHESHLPVLSPRELLKYRCHLPRLKWRVCCW
jgi:hypothetical protein